MMPDSTARLTPAQLEKWVSERVLAIAEVAVTSPTEAAGMLRSGNFGLNEVLAVRVCASLTEPYVAALVDAINLSVAREHKLMRDMARHRREQQQGSPSDRVADAMGKARKKRREGE